MFSQPSFLLMKHRNGSLHKLIDCAALSELPQQCLRSGEETATSDPNPPRCTRSSGYSHKAGLARAFRLEEIPFQRAYAHNRDGSVSGALDRLTGLPAAHPDLIKTLQVDPEFRTRAEEVAQSQRRIAGDGAPSIQDFSDATGWNMEPPRQSCRLIPSSASSSAKCRRGGSKSRA